MANSKEVIELNMVLKDGFQTDNMIQKPFHPAITHQLFGPTEKINGYRNVYLRFYVCAHSLAYHISIENRGPPLNQKACEKLLGMFAEWFPSNINQISDFQNIVKSQDYKLYFGQIAGHFQTADGSNYIYTRCKRPNKDQMEFHRRFESLAVFYVDAISKIVANQSWSFIYIYKCINGGYFPIGFATIIRHAEVITISQVFLMPNYQGLRIGTMMLEFIYKLYAWDARCTIIDVEKPCPAYQALRDRVDMEILNHQKFNFLEPKYERFVENARRRMKITEAQIRHIYRGMEYVRSVTALQRKEFLTRYKLLLIEENAKAGIVDKHEVRYCHSVDVEHFNKILHYYKTYVIKQET